MNAPSLRQELAQLQIPMKKRIPRELRCSWEKAPPEFGNHVYHCEVCECWTANPDQYRSEVCPGKERRKHQAEILGDRRRA